MSWTIAETQKPQYVNEPQTKKIDHIGVKVKYFAVSPLDVAQLQRSKKITHTLGTSAFGLVDYVPDSLNGSFAIGDWVGVSSVKTNNQEGASQFSYYSQYIYALPESVFVVPKSIPQQSIASLLGEGVIAYAALARYARPQDNVAIIGAGTLAFLAASFAKSLGYKTTIISTKQELSSFKAPEGVDISQDIGKCGLKFHLVLNCVLQSSTENFSKQISTVRRGGRLVILGGLSASDLELPFGSIIFQQREVSFLKQATRNEIHEALELASKHHIYPKSSVQNFDKTGQVFEEVKQSKSGQNSIVIQI